jgi:uncharacterized protein
MPMKKLMLFLFLTCTIFTSINAQNVEKQAPYIDVTGSAEMEVVPDEIYLFIRLQERKQGKTVLIQEVELKNKLTQIGINLENLSIKNFVGDFRAYKMFKKDMQGTKEFILKLNNGKQLDSVFYQLDLLDVEDAKIERLSHSKMPEFRKEVKTKAIKAAKEKADYLLTAIGEQTGKPIYIIENQDNDDMYNQAQYRSNAVSIYKERSDSDDSKFISSEFQKLRIRFTISARFSIK